MKKISLVLLMLLAYSTSTMAQSTVPVPADPDPQVWYDYVPIVLPNDSIAINSGWFFLSYGQDFYSNLVATDYDVSIDSCIVHELHYTILDWDKFSYSIYTDFDEIFVFTPEEYSEFQEPTTDVFVFHFLPPTEDGWGSSTNFEFWGPHFPNRTNQVEGFDMEPFFKWRIGIQTHYTVGGVTTSSNIVYLEVYPKPVSMLGDVNDDGKVSITDVTALISYLLSGEADPFNKFNADANDDDKHTISDVTAIINILLGQ